MAMRYLTTQAAVTGALALITLSPLSHAQSTPPAGTFTIATWGGEYADSQVRALFQPFATTEDLAFDIVDFPGDPAAVDFQIQSGQVTWDVVDLEMKDTVDLCARGGLERLDPVINKIDINDFVDGAVQDCSLGNVTWSMGVTYDPSWFSSENQAAPSSYLDFFDDRLRGDRAAAASPVGLMELASLASGIAANDIYNSLASSEGIALALDTLAGIGDDLQWYANDLEAFDAVANAQASMAFVPHILPAREAVQGGVQLGFFWDAHFYQMDAFSIVRDAPNKSTAVSFVIDSGLPAYQGTMSTLSLYGPTNLKAHDFVSQSVLPWMPHAQGNREGAILLDAAWWDSEAAQAAIDAFDAWRGQ